jgi:RNA polymerase sigma factor (sigma-70 family)
MTAHNIIEYYRKEIYRIGWRIQYKAKVTYRSEVPIISDTFPDHHFNEQLDNKILVHELISSLPSVIEQTVLREIFIYGKTESQVAKELKITQQAVNKWKKKALNKLSQTVSF